MFFFLNWCVSNSIPNNHTWIIFFEFTVDDNIIQTRIVWISPYDLCSTIRIHCHRFHRSTYTGAKKNFRSFKFHFFFRLRSFDCDCLQCYRLKWILMHPVTYKVAWLGQKTSLPRPKSLTNSVQRDSLEH